MAATFEKAITYIFAERLIRNAEVVGSNPICSTKRLNLKHLVDCWFPTTRLYSHQTQLHQCVIALTAAFSGPSGRRTRDAEVSR